MGSDEDGPGSRGTGRILSSPGVACLASHGGLNGAQPFGGAAGDAALGAAPA